MQHDVVHIAVIRTNVEATRDQVISLSHSQVYTQREENETEISIFQRPHIGMHTRTHTHTHSHTHAPWWPFFISVSLLFFLFFSFSSFLSFFLSFFLSCVIVRPVPGY